MSYKISEETVIGTGSSEKTTPAFTMIGNFGIPITIPEGKKRIPATAAESMTIYGQKDSLLEKKAFLQFEYPNTTDPNGPPIMVRLPFYEDPEIRESKSARYASMKPLSRASELFAYLGSDARTFSLSFKITLPHLSNLWNTNKSMAGNSTGDPEQNKAKFFSTAGFSERGEGQIGPKSSDYTNAFRPAPPVDADQLGELGFPLTEEGYTRFRKDTDVDRANAIKDIFVYWMDIIRSSVYNNVQNPIFGPPIVRLTFGMMYRAIPCLVFNYALSYDPNTGYDKDTLIPRVVKIDMELKEIRTGDYGTFKPDQAYSVAGENLAGWESVITASTNEIGGTLDVIPVIGPIGQGG